MGPTRLPSCTLAAHRASAFPPWNHLVVPCFCLRHGAHHVGGILTAKSLGRFVALKSEWLKSEWLRTNMRTRMAQIKLRDCRIMYVMCVWIWFNMMTSWDQSVSISRCGDAAWFDHCTYARLKNPRPSGTQGIQKTLRFDSRRFVRVHVYWVYVSLYVMIHNMYLLYVLVQSIPSVKDWIIRTCFSTWTKLPSRWHPSVKISLGERQFFPKRTYSWIYKDTKTT